MRTWIELVIISMRFSCILSNLSYWSLWNAGIHSFIQIKETNTKKRITFKKKEINVMDRKGQTFLWQQEQI